MTRGADRKEFGNPLDNGKKDNQSHENLDSIEGIAQMDASPRFAASYLSVSS